MVELDELYAKALLELSVATRLDYCYRLLSRCRFEQSQVSCARKRKQLETIIKSTRTEIYKLKSQSKLRKAAPD